MRHRLDRVTDEWYESEPSTRLGMIEEVQRIQRRTRARPVPVLLLAAAITFAVTYKLSTRAGHFEAEVVLALAQGSLSMRHNGIPVDDLRQYVDGVLLPDRKLSELIERRNLYPLRRKAGIEYALDQLRQHLDIQIWKNSFVYYDADAENPEHSARIGIAFSDSDPDRAYEIAHDLAAIVMETAREQREKLDTELAAEVATARDTLSKRLDELAHASAAKQSALLDARAHQQADLAAALELELASNDRAQKRAQKTLDDLASSPDALADRIAAAGLDMTLSIVEENRPERPQHRGFELVLIAVVIGIGALLGSALVVGAFDSRVHDTDDVERLGLPVLGHVPGFAGDHVGSLAARGASGRRVPSFARWRSHP